jgi:hypothetical protein
MINNQKGFALAQVLIIFLIFSLLGTVIITVSTSQVLESTRQVERIKAHYIAYSGADAMASWLIEQFQNNQETAMITLASIIAAGESSPTTIGEGEFTIDITGTPGEEISIRAIGAVGNSQQTVILTLEPNTTGGTSTSLDLDTAVFSLTSFQLTGSSSIIGSVGTNSTQANSVSFGYSTSVEGGFLVGPGGDPNNVISVSGHGRTPSNNITGAIGSLSNERNYELPIFPDFPTGLPTELFRTIYNSSNAVVEEGMGQIPVVGASNYKATIVIPEDGYFQDTLTIQGNQTLTIDLQNSTRILRLNNLNITQGHIQLTNPGSLILYVQDAITLGGDSKINNNGDSSDVILYYKGAGAPNIGGNTRYYGSIYLERADLTIGGSNGIIGHIVSGGQNVTITGNAEANVRVLYAPNAAVVFQGSGRAKGPVISNSFQAIGNAKVFYNPDEDTLDTPFPFTFSNGSFNGYRKGIWQ